MRIIGLGRIKKMISRFLGNAQKKKFEKFLYSDEGNRYFAKTPGKKAVDLELVTFVNAASFADLMLAVLSFLHATGTPSRWTLYADDEFSDQQKSVLSNFTFVNVKKWNEKTNEADHARYAVKWQLRKFAAYASHPVNGTTVFLDSDVLFYPLFTTYFEDIRANNWYLPEPPEASNIDHGLADLFDYKREMYIVNAGFFIMNEPANWQKGFDYLDHCSKSEKDHYFLDQSALNLMFYHDSQARILDPRIFHATANDHFMLTALKPGAFAIRHYVGLIRHKMWQLGWKQFLN